MPKERRRFERTWLTHLKECKGTEGWEIKSKRIWNNC